MKHFITFLISISFCFQLLAQLTDCDCSNRYETEIFNDINDITTAFKKTLEDFYK